MPTYEVGDRVLCPAIRGTDCGMGTVEAVEDHHGRLSNVVRLDEGGVAVVPVDLSYPHPLPSVEEAEERLARLLAPLPPDERSWKERYADFTHRMRDFRPEPLAIFLRTQWARPGRTPFGERQMLHILEAVVVAPVAEALGMEPQEIVRQARQRSG